MKLINFERFNSEPYAEIGQANPLRWMNVKPVDGGYECVSHWWKCKDFMNDAITAKHLNKTFKIYGFECNPEKFYSPGQVDMPLLLKNTKKSFIVNIDVLNKHLKNIKFPKVKLDPVDDMFLLTLPEKYLENTLYMSTITLYVRMCNTDKEYKCLDNMIDDEWNDGDQNNYKATKQKPINKLSEDKQKYIWYYGEYNCPRDGSIQQFMTSTMHNCGVVNWSF